MPCPAQHKDPHPLLLLFRGCHCPALQRGSVVPCLRVFFSLYFCLGPGAFVACCSWASVFPALRAHSRVPQRGCAVSCPGLGSHFQGCWIPDLAGFLTILDLSFLIQKKKG